MRRFLAAGVVALLLVAGAAIPSKAAIKGDYLEVRSADVYTGPCFANGEVGLVGDQAILAWKVTEGSWNGVTLNGLGVVAVAKASATLGDPFHNPYPAQVGFDCGLAPHRRAANSSGRICEVGGRRVADERCARGERRHRTGSGKGHGARRGEARGRQPGAHRDALVVRR